jgi:hypothetical protein
MMIRGAILVASMAGAAAFSTPVPDNCPEYIFQPQPVYALGACDSEAGPAKASAAAPFGCPTQKVSIPLPVCEKTDFRRQANYNTKTNTLNVKITALLKPDGHPLTEQLTSAGFQPINQVFQATLRDQGMFDSSIVNENTKIVLDVATSDLTATYGWSGLPGEELEVVGAVSSLKFGCNAYGPYEVFMVACSTYEVQCLVGLAFRYADAGASRGLLSAPEEVGTIARVASHLTGAGSLFGLATGVALEGGRHLLGSRHVLAVMCKDGSC